MSFTAISSPDDSFWDTLVVLALAEPEPGHPADEEGEPASPADAPRAGNAGPLGSRPGEG